MSETLDLVRCPRLGGVTLEAALNPVFAQASEMSDDVADCPPRAGRHVLVTEAATQQLAETSMDS
jgi:hypothetical protein